MKLASHNLANHGYRFDPVGVEFADKELGGVFFWTAPYFTEKFGEKPDRAFKWIPVAYPGESYWKEVDPAVLGKKRQEALEFWQKQDDKGLWIAHPKFLATQQQRMFDAASADYELAFQKAWLSGLRFGEWLRENRPNYQNRTGNRRGDGGGRGAGPGVVKKKVAVQ